MFETRPANCGDDRVWVVFTDEIPDDDQALSIFTYTEICEARGFELQRPSALGKRVYEGL